MNRLLFIDKTRPSLTPRYPPGRGEWLRYSSKYKFCSLYSLHRFLCSPGLAKPTTGIPALRGVPARLGSLFLPSSARKYDASNSWGSDVSTLRDESKSVGRRDFAV